MSPADSVLADITLQSRQEFLPLPGAELTSYLQWVAREERPVRALDVGSMTGYSTIAIARNLRSGCRVIGLEISGELAGRAAANIQLAGLSDKAKIIRADAVEGVQKLTEPLNLVFLDAARAQYRNLLRRLESKLAPGALVVANLSGARPKDLASYVKFVQDSARFSSQSRTFDGAAAEISRYMA